MNETPYGCVHIHNPGVCPDCDKERKRLQAYADEAVNQRVRQMQEKRDAAGYPKLTDEDLLKAMRAYPQVTA